MADRSLSRSGLSDGGDKYEYKEEQSGWSVRNNNITEDFDRDRDRDNDDESDRDRDEEDILTNKIENGLKGNEKAVKICDKSLTAHECNDTDRDKEDDTESERGNGDDDDDDDDSSREKTAKVERKANQEFSKRKEVKKDEGKEKGMERVQVTKKPKVRVNCHAYSISM